MVKAATIRAALIQPRLPVMSALSKPTLRLLDTHSLGVMAGWVGRATTPFLRLQSDYGLTIRDPSLNIRPLSGLSVKPASSGF